MNTTVYVYTTKDPQGWDYAIYHNHIVVIAIVSGHEKQVWQYIKDHYDDPDTYGTTTKGEKLSRSRDCEYIEL